MLYAAFIKNKLKKYFFFLIQNLFNKFIFRAIERNIRESLIDNIVFEEKEYGKTNK